MEDGDLIISDSERWYKILQPIGTWGPDFSLVVYEAVILGPIDADIDAIDDDDDDLTHVAFKMIKDTDDLQDFHEMVVDDVNRSNEFVVAGSRNVLPIVKSFYCEIDGDQTLCIVLAYDTHAVSLRSLLSSNPKLATGLHDKFIGIVLERVLRALDEIHRKGKHHMQITAGNIFYNCWAETIQLAYAASVYEHDTDFYDGNVCSVNNMLAWGLAPEVKDDDESLEFVDTYDTKKSDIWLVGIAALELAYGQIPVENRRELLGIARYISEVKTLPNTWEELRHNTAEFAAEKNFPFKKRRASKGEQASTTALATETEERRFSNNFSNLVAMCLDGDVNKRASVRKLQKHAFIKKNRVTMAYFRDVIVKEVNPHISRFFSGKPRKKSASPKSIADNRMINVATGQATRFRLSRFAPKQY